MSQLIMMLLLLFFLNKAVCQEPNQNGGELNFNGGNNMYTSGSTNLNKNGLLTLTNATQKTTGQVFYNRPLRFKDSVNGTVYSSTTFVFAIEFHNGSLGGYGLAFVISPTRDFPLTFPRNMGDPKNHVVAVELDLTFDEHVGDINANHVGIDINTLVSDKTDSARYFKDDGTPINLPILVEILCSCGLNMTANINSLMLHFILFLSLSQRFHSFLCKRILEDQREMQSLERILVISLSVSGVIIVIFLILGLWLFLKKKKLMEVVEDWEVQFGPHRIAYKDLRVSIKRPKLIMV